MKQTRREFITKSGAAVAATAVSLNSLSQASAAPKQLRIAIIGTGSRGTFTWGKPVVENYSDMVEIVGLCDINPKRVEAAKSFIGIKAPTFVDFDRMIKEVKPDSVVVTTIDATHYRYIIRALELGCDVITEKPLCTDEQQCQAILDAEKRTGKHVTVTFNARHFPEAKKVKQLLMEKAVGDVISVDFHEYLDTSHGADLASPERKLRHSVG